MSGVNLPIEITFKLDQTQLEELRLLGSWLSLKGDAIVTGLNELVSAVERLAPPPTARFAFWGAGIPYIEGDALIMNLKNNHQIHGKLNFHSLQGGVAAHEPGSIKFESTAPDHFTVVSPDPTVLSGGDEATFLVKGNPNSPSDDTAVGLVRATYDAVKGDEVRTIVKEAAINVIPADADVSELELGPSEPQPIEEPAPVPEPPAPEPQPQPEPEP